MFFARQRRSLPSTESPFHHDSAAARIRRAQRSFNLRRVPEPALLNAGLSDTHPPSPGDLVLASVDGLGQHTRLQLVSGRRFALTRGDEILVAYGDRYATSQFEAEVPEDLSECHLVAAGGIASRVVSRCTSVKSATRITPVGLLTGPDNTPLNLANFALESRSSEPCRVPLTVAVLGTTMDAGKTTTVASMIRGLRASGLQVSSIKASGTGACGDYFAMLDAGANPVLDVVDAGLVTSYRVAEDDVEQCFKTLLAHASDSADAVVIEIADGLLQAETARLIRSKTFRSAVDSVVLACGDALGAIAGQRILEASELPLVGISGRVTASELGTREASTATEFPVLTLRDLQNPEIVNLVAPRLGGTR